MATRESARSERVEDAPESSTESHPEAQLDRVENVDEHDSLPESLTQTMPKQCTGPEGNTLPSKEVTQLTSDLDAIGVHVQSGSGDSNLRATLSCISQAGRVTDSDKTVGSAADGIKRLFKDVELLKGSVPSDGVVGLYFSAHWCPPCRAFTPKLAETYNNIKKVGDKVFEIVFISSDKDQAQFDSYFAEMPWLAVPFEQSGLRTQLSNKFEVGGIPTLVLLNAKTGTVITADGRAALSRDPAGENYPWADAAEPAKTSPAAPGPAAPGKFHPPATSGARAVRISPGTQVAMLLPMVCCATVCALIFSLPYLVVAAVKGPGTEFCGGYWQNSTATSMPASLGGRVRAAPMKRSQRLALRLTAPHPPRPLSAVHHTGLVLCDRVHPRPAARRHHRHYGGGGVGTRGGGGALLLPLPVRNLRLQLVDLRQRLVRGSAATSLFLFRSRYSMPYCAAPGKRAIMLVDRFGVCCAPNPPK